MYRTTPLLYLVRLVILGSVGFVVGNAAQASERTADYVITISVDGLRPDAVTSLGSERAPNFYRLRSEGAFTDTARTARDSTETLPNHASMFTARSVLDKPTVFGPESGHHWTTNSNAEDWGPPAVWGASPVETIHQNAGYYVHSTFDVAHDAGLSTALYATKRRFHIFEQTWSDKIDIFEMYNLNSSGMMDAFLANMSNPETRSDYTFMLFNDADLAGHRHTWSRDSDSEYLKAVEEVDGHLGKIFDLIESIPAMSGRTTVILTSDHGGPLGENWHHDAANIANYRVPFYVWGAGVEAGDLYEMNEGDRENPGRGRPLYGDPTQPVRNSDSANLAMQLLGLDPIPGSHINVMQDLVIREPEG